MRNWKQIVLVLMIIISSIACDQATKVMANSYLPKSGTLSFAGGALRLQYGENKGAVFTFESALPKEWQGSISTGAVVLFLGSLLACLMHGSALRPAAAIALSLVCGGGLSNLLDRVAFGGYVVDFVSVRVGGWRIGLFNLADVAIAAGAALFLLSSVWNLRRSTAR